MFVTLSPIFVANTKLKICLQFCSSFKEQLTQQLLLTDLFKCIWYKEYLKLPKHLYFAYK